MASKLLKEKVSQMIVLEELIPVIYVFVIGNEPLRRYRLKKSMNSHRRNVKNF